MTRSSMPLRRLRTDDGMTVVEVAIAAAVLLFAITALLGLLGVSTTMTAKSKTQNVAVNTANSVVEKIRAESFPSLTQSKVDSITAASSGRFGNVTTVVTGVLTPIRLSGVTESQPPSYYKLTVSVVATGIGAPTTFTTSTYIRRWRMETDPSMVKPSVAFTAVTPAQSEIVWGTRQVGADAQSNMPAVDLMRLAIKAGGTTLVETTATAQTMFIHDYPWNTASVDASNNIQWEGQVALTAEARDPNQLQISSRTVVVDNYPPAATPTPALEAVTATNTVVWQWNSIMDGNVPVDDYDFRVWKQSGSSSAFALDAGYPVYVNPAVKSGIQRQRIGTTSFSRYYISVRARSPRETYLGYTWPTPSPTGTSGIYISRPGVNGSTCNIVYAGHKNGNDAATFSAVLKCDPPTFANSSSDGVYHWQYKYGTQPWAKVVTDYVSTNPYSTGTLTAPVVGKIANNPIQFRCLVNITPTGTGTPVYVPSSIVTFGASSAGAAAQTGNTWEKWDTSTVHGHTINWSSWSL